MPAKQGIRQEGCVHTVIKSRAGILVIADTKAMLRCAENEHFEQLENDTPMNSAVRRRDAGGASIVGYGLAGLTAYK